MPTLGFARGQASRRVSMRHARVRAPHRVSPMTPALSRWIFPVTDPPAAERLAAALGIGTPAAKVLANRGFADPAEARRFLEASLDDLHDPLGLRDMERAAARLEKAIRGREKILIYGDYDVDGATSVALLMKAIELAGGRRQLARPAPPERRLRHAPRSGGSRRRAGGDADRQRGYRNPRGRSGAARGRAGRRRHRHRPPPARGRSAARARRAQPQPRRTAPIPRRTCAAPAWPSSWRRPFWRGSAGRRRSCAASRNRF